MEKPNRTFYDALTRLTAIVSVLAVELGTGRSSRSDLP